MHRFGDASILIIASAFSPAISLYVRPYYFRADITSILTIASVFRIAVVSSLHGGYDSSL